MKRHRAEVGALVHKLNTTYPHTFTNFRFPSPIKSFSSTSPCLRNAGSWNSGNGFPMSADGNTVRGPKSKLFKNTASRTANTSTGMKRSTRFGRVKLANSIIRILELGERVGHSRPFVHVFADIFSSLLAELPSPNQRSVLVVFDT